MLLHSAFTVNTDDGQMMDNLSRWCVTCTAPYFESTMCCHNHGPFFFFCTRVKSSLTCFRKHWFEDFPTVYLLKRTNSPKTIRYSSKNSDKTNTLNTRGQTQLMFQQKNIYIKMNRSLFLLIIQEYLRSLTKSTTFNSPWSTAEVN